jgi:ABC-type nitrate/sulfonate/bicarbonate transport system ATPase subunit
MNVRENVRLPLRVGGVHTPDDGRVDRLLAVTGLKEFGDKYPCELSGGMQQRAGICRALDLPGFSGELFAPAVSSSRASPRRPPG